MRNALNPNAQVLLSLLLVLTIAVACNSEDEGSEPSPNNATNDDLNNDSPTPTEGSFAVLVRGPLFTDDLEQAQAYHDALASEGEEPAKEMGDIAHDALLGTSLLGSPQGQFMGLDRWNNFEGMGAFYSNPDFGQAFGMLFSQEPTVETFEETDWAGWGDLDAADDVDERFFVVVRGTLAQDPQDAGPAHDAVASAGEAQAREAGDVAHVTFLGVEDDRQFLGIDVWTSSDNIEAFYGNPDFQAAFLTLFAAPPTVEVYGSTDWHQW